MRFDVLEELIEKDHIYDDNINKNNKYNSNYDKFNKKISEFSIDDFHKKETNQNQNKITSYPYSYVNAKKYISYKNKKYPPHIFDKKSEFSYKEKNSILNIPGFMANIDHNEELPLEDVEFDIPNDEIDEKSHVLEKKEFYRNFAHESIIKKKDEKINNSTFKNKFEIYNYDYKKEEKCNIINKKLSNVSDQKQKESLFEKGISEPMLSVQQQNITYNEYKENTINYQILGIKSNAFNNKCIQSNEKYFKKDNDKKFEDIYMLSESFQSLNSGKFDDFKKKLEKNNEFFKLQKEKKKNNKSKILSKSVGFNYNNNCSNISNKNGNNSFLKSNISNNKVFINKFPKIENKTTREIPKTSSVNKNFLSYILKIPKSSFQSNFNNNQNNSTNPNKEIFNKFLIGLQKNRSCMSQSENTQNFGLNNHSIIAPNENKNNEENLFTKKLSLNLANLFNAYKQSKFRNNFSDLKNNENDMKTQNDGSSDLNIRKFSDDEPIGIHYNISNSKENEFLNVGNDHHKNSNILKLQKIQEENFEQTYENFSGSSNQNLDNILKSNSINSIYELSPGMKLFAESKIKADKDILLQEENCFLNNNNDIKEFEIKKSGGEKNKIKLATLSKLEEKLHILKETNPNKFKVSEKYSEGLIKSLKKIGKETNLFINFMDKNKFSSFSKINDLKIFKGQKKF